ncbi:MAG: FAD-binding protein [Chloroflexi bacterium]|nr:FAD-binding protein [Chloroflexota bacterium]
MNTLSPASFEDVQAAIRATRAGARLIPRGGGSKPALSAPGQAELSLDLSALSGVVEYNPGEYTFTALAGTRIAEVRALLAAQGQYLPFDPPLAERGATLGGTVASGLSGAGRYRFGGVRDFILGVRFVDGNGDLVRGGGKVVKNAAGFDIPKLMVGSLGQFGVMVELTFKVFPAPAAFITIRRRYPALDTAVTALIRTYAARLDVDSLDLTPDADGSASVWVRLGGLPDALPARAERIRNLLEGGDILDGEDEAHEWRAAGEFGWVPAGWTLAKVPLTPRRIAPLEAALGGMQTMRRYSSGGNVAWLAIPARDPCEGRRSSQGYAMQELDHLLAGLELPGLVVFGPPGLPHRPVRIGVRNGQVFERRVKAVFDPAGRLPLY